MANERAKNTRLPLADLVRPSAYSRLAGYEDVNDAQWLSQDPAFRLIGAGKIWERGAALLQLAPKGLLDYIKFLGASHEKQVGSSCVQHRITCVVTRVRDR